MFIVVLVETLLTISAIAVADLASTDTGDSANQKHYLQLHNQNHGLTLFVGVKTVLLIVNTDGQNTVFLVECHHIVRSHELIVDM